MVRGETVVLRSVDLRVGAGSSLAVTGPSGSGKSTLVACLAGLVQPTSGEVVVDGRVVSGLSEVGRARFRRERLGLVFQDPELFEELSVTENAALSLMFAGVPRAQALTRAVAALEAVGMGELGSAFPRTLSGGEAQRVAVARALATDRAVIVADEPTASLDAANAAAVSDLLLDACARGAAVVLATHDPEVAARCDAVLDLRHWAQPGHLAGE